MRWTFFVPDDERRESGRRSRVVLTPRRWRQALRQCPQGDGGKKARFTRESTKETVKTIAQGMPGYSGEPVVTTLVCFFIFAREAMGAAGARRSLRPLLSEGVRFVDQLGRFTSRERETMPSAVMPREGGASSTP
jgi:hypothetical protein